MKEAGRIYLIAGLASILLSGWISWRETVINPDAICYLLSAQAMGTQSFSQIMHLCPQAIWPFYSALIFFFAKGAHLSMLVSANVLDGFFTLLSVTMFIAIVQSLGGTRRVLWLAAFVILFSHDFNSVRQYIVRDHGYWAFYLVSLYFFLRCLRDMSWLNVLGWSTALLMATIFRIEGAVFFLLLPIAVVFQPGSWRECFWRYFKLNVPLLLGVAALMSWLILHPGMSVNQLGRVGEIGQHLSLGLSVILNQYTSTETALIQHVLPHEAARDAGLVWVLTLIIWYFTNVVENLSWIAALLLGYAWWKSAAKWLSSERLAVLAYLVVNLVITAVFFAEHLFLSKRYLTALTLVLLLWVPFALEVLYRQWNQARYRRAFIAAMMLLAASSIGVLLNIGPSKTYLLAGGDWLSAHVAQHERLYANDLQLMYYSNHYGMTIFEKLQTYHEVGTLAHQKWKQYDYIALRLGRHDDAEWRVAAAEIGAAPIQEFTSSRGDKVVIYRHDRHRGERT